VSPLLLVTVLALFGFASIVGLSVAGSGRPPTGPVGPGTATPAKSPAADGDSAQPSDGSAPAASSLPALVAPSEPEPSSLANGRSLGRADAPVTLVVWSDYQCPACAALVRQVQARIVSDFVVTGDVKLVYRDYAFIGQESVDAAVAARCAADQGNFWSYHDYLFWNQGGENAGGFDRAHLDAIAEAVGLARPTFDRCLDSPTKVADVSADTAAAQAAGVNYTPTLQIGPTMMPGAPLTDDQYDVLRKVIERSVAAPSPTVTQPATAAP
jgi:protein-disulfide isomerase